ncbi:L,D-transpeptidase family protein [Qipengyuania flava]|nr:L,D-transpeptidase family protein [Qipengyuania flava]QYJ08507.1 L,D-transpeptidase family protein [Qipengyuania flava]
MLTMRAFALPLALALVLAAGLAPAEAVHAQQARAGERADFVLIDKSDRKLWVYQDGKVIRSYSGLQYGDQPVGHKRFQGDERTPEGRYTITYGNEQSSYYLSLFINYPNAADRAYARARGRSPGGLIFIHGQPNGLPFDARVPGDWTDGCIALSNAEIAELWSLVPDGTPIEIRP